MDSESNNAATRPGQKAAIRKLAVKRNATPPVDPNRSLKLWIWIYIFLWIFEGALRKWVVPALSMPLLLVRDPIVLLLIFMSLKRGLIKVNFYLTAMVVLGILSLFTAVFMGHGNFYVALYGARTMALYFPMIFVMASVFNQEDVLKVGKFILLLTIPMTVLLGLQFYSPQSAWVNLGVGGDDDGGGFGGALGFFRAPTTFSFANGTACFYSMVAPFLIYFWLHGKKKINRLILIGATAGLLIAIPLSISRTVFFSVAISVIFMLIAVSRNPKYFGKIFVATIGVVLALVVLSNVSFFQTATEVFTDRFEGANESEGGLVEGVIGERFLGTLIKAISGSTEQSAFGFGVGSGTTLGADLLGDNRIALLADFEWMREIGELGMMGLIVIALRVGFAIKVTLASYRKVKLNDMLPWLIASVSILTITQGQWHQSTALGFHALIGGLWLASLNKPALKKANVANTPNRNGKNSRVTSMQSTKPVQR